MSDNQLRLHSINRVSRWISALDTACPSVKKQVVELLSALSVYSQDGRQRAIDTLHEYQVIELE